MANSEKMWALMVYINENLTPRSYKHKMSEAFEEIKGKPIQFTKKTEVDVVYNGEPSKVNVFQIDFVKNAKK